MKHFINEYYRYPDGKTKFKLVEVIKWKFLFECGHWCTDNVFMDLIRVRTGKQVFEDLQIELFKNEQETTS